MEIILNSDIMRKILFSVAALFAISTMSAQDGGFSLGLHAGIPMGDIKDTSSANFGVDVAYMWPMGEGFNLGIASGYTNYSAKEYDIVTYSPELGFVTSKFKRDDAGFIPLAAAARLGLTENFFIGADLGYAFYTGDGDANGGFYYQPKVGYDFMPFELFLAYKGISLDGGTFSSVNLGAAYKF